MFETIIVPLDGSTIAEVALPYAEELAARFGSLLVLLFVKEPNDYRSLHIIQCYLENMAEKAQMAASQFLAESGISKLETQSLILTGNPADEIITFAEKQTGGYIIMADHGESGAHTRWALGSVAEKVVKAVNLPVGVIRARGAEPAVHEARLLREILVTLDGSEESECALPVAKEMAIRLKASVTLLMIESVEILQMSLQGVREAADKRKTLENYLGKKTSELQQSGITAKYVFEMLKMDVAEEINRFTQENHEDVVIMATHGRSGPSRWILGSVANKVMQEGNTPLILIRTPGHVNSRTA